MHCMSTDGVYTVSLYFRGQRNRADVLVGATVDRQWTDSGQRQTATRVVAPDRQSGSGTPE